MMRSHPKADKEKKESVRLTKLFKRIASLPIACLILPCGWLKRVFVGRQSPADQRIAEKQRQAGIRRELRGLPPKPDAQKPAA
jgi:hypothetical protein